MSTMPLDVAADEFGLVRIFGVDVSDSLGRRLRRELGDDGACPALKDALGAKQVDSYWVDLVALNDIRDMGLGAYLAEGWAVPRDEIDTLKTKLEGQDHVLIVPSRAFGGGAQRLHPALALDPLAAFRTSEPMPAREPTPRADVSPGDADTARRDEEKVPPGRRHGARNAVILLAIAVVVILVLAGFA